MPGQENIRTWKHDNISHRTDRSIANSSLSCLVPAVDALATISIGLCQLAHITNPRPSWVTGSGGSNERHGLHSFRYRKVLLAKAIWSLDYYGSSVTVSGSAVATKVLTLHSTFVELNNLTSSYRQTSDQHFEIPRPERENRVYSLVIIHIELICRHEADPRASCH